LATEASEASSAVGSLLSLSYSKPQYDTGEGIAELFSSQNIDSFPVLESEELARENDVIDYLTLAYYLTKDEAKALYNNTKRYYEVVRRNNLSSQEPEHQKNILQEFINKVYNRRNPNNPVLYRVSGKRKESFNGGKLRKTSKKNKQKLTKKKYRKNRVRMTRHKSKNLKQRYTRHK